MVLGWSCVRLVQADGRLGVGKDRLEKVSLEMGRYMASSWLDSET